MIFRQLDSQGDWTFGNGLQGFATNQNAINLDVKTALQFWQNDCFFAMDFGIDWMNLIGGKNPAAEQNIILQCRQMIFTRYGVTRINSVSPTLNVNTRALTVNYDVNSIYSTGNTGAAQTV